MRCKRTTGESEEERRRDYLTRRELSSEKRRSWGPADWGRRSCRRRRWLLRGGETETEEDIQVENVWGASMQSWRQRSRVKKKNPLTLYLSCCWSHCFIQSPSTCGFQRESVWDQSFYVKSMKRALIAFQWKQQLFNDDVSNQPAKKLEWNWDSVIQWFDTVINQNVVHYWT